MALDTLEKTPGPYIRIRERRSNIRCEDENNPVPLHFRKAGHNLSSLRYVAIEKVGRPPRGRTYERLLLQRETFHIHALDTIHAPYGLNEEFDLKPFNESIQTILYLPVILCLTVISVYLLLVIRDNLLHHNV